PADGLQLTNNLRQRVEVLEVLADRVQVVLDAVSDGWDVRVPRHVYAYASSSSSSISRRFDRLNGRPTRQAVTYTYACVRSPLPSSRSRNTAPPPMLWLVPSTARSTWAMPPLAWIMSRMARCSAYVMGRVRSVQRRYVFPAHSCCTSCTYTPGSGTPPRVVAISAALPMPSDCQPAQARAGATQPPACGQSQYHPGPPCAES